jgi:hypothetical protein
MQTGMSYEEAIELAKQEFPDTSAKDRKLDKEERLEEYMRKKTG